MKHRLRPTLRTLLPSVLLSVALSLALPALISCSADDTAPLPAYVQGLADLVTDGSGHAATLTTDDGHTLTLTQGINGLHPDTAYRVVAAYVPSADGTQARLASYSPILSLPVRAYRPGFLKTEPLGLTACWRGATHLNLHLAVKGTPGKTHYFGFALTEVLDNADGSRTLCATLYHNADGDPAYVTRDTYLSLPLSSVSKLLQKGRDSIRLSVNTLSGWWQKTFAV